MANNLIVSYDLHAPGQNYEKVAEAIKRLGSWAKVHYSLWYVKADLLAEQAAQHVWKSMDANDRLVVIDTTNNNAYWNNLPADVTKFIQEHWYR